MVDEPTMPEQDSVIWLYEAGPPKARTFDEWFADYLAEAPLRAHRRGLSQEQRDRLARGLWYRREQVRAEKKSGEAWRGLRPRM
ncbi:hypothetical protein G3545_08485 [Starkeya sp. ORNL1]|uniref:hypothetical protein n=1 Tax=Starkeya sp. ORNL1 TaxID=2709380 RepID=UPI001462C89E|nr:hypothetical protein [Starkeya sp. ORNL1]QJP13689.1 hypothetical protein G3545_08485 [Starkeya sp. ORNL1]